MGSQGHAHTDLRKKIKDREVKLHLGGIRSQRVEGED